MSRNQFGTVAIVGVGLIGGSIGLALKKAGVVTEVIGVGRSASNLEEAKKLGVIEIGEWIEKIKAGDPTA